MSLFLVKGSNFLSFQTHKHSLSLIGQVGFKLLSDREAREGEAVRSHTLHSHCHLHCLEPLAGFCVKV